MPSAHTRLVRRARGGGIAAAGEPRPLVRHHVEPVELIVEQVFGVVKKFAAKHDDAIRRASPGLPRSERKIPARRRPFRSPSRSGRGAVATRRPPLATRKRRPARHDFRERLFDTLLAELPAVFVLELLADAGHAELPVGLLGLANSRQKLRVARSRHLGPTPARPEDDLPSEDTKKEN